MRNYLFITLLASGVILLSSAISDEQLQAVHDIYNQMNGPNWRYKTNWMNGNDPCLGGSFWFGLTCIDGIIISLNLINNNLTGSIPESIGYLTSLGDIFLFDNQISGPLPSSIGNFKSLTALYIYNNQISGPIPESFGNLDRLQAVSMINNQISGSIPESIGNMKSLLQLHLGSNKLSGPIPKSIGNLSSLSVLNLYNNAITGMIPESMGNMTQLRTLHLYSNQLTGPIPKSFGNLSLLKVLRINNNNLTGPIPQELSNLSQLTRMEVQTNSLCGPLPTWTVEPATISWDSKQLSCFTSTTSVLSETTMSQTTANSSSFITNSIFSQSNDYVSTELSTQTPTLSNSNNPTSFETITSNQIQTLTSTEQVFISSSDSSQTDTSSGSNDSRSDLMIIISASSGSLLLLVTITSGIIMRLKRRRNNNESFSNDVTVGTQQTEILNSKNLLTTSEYSEIGRINPSNNPNIKNSQNDFRINIEQPTLYATSILKQIISLPLSLKIELSSNFRENNNQANLRGGMSQITYLELINDFSIDKSRLCKPQEKIFVLKKMDNCVDTKSFQFEVAVMKAIENNTNYSVKLMAWNEIPFNFIIMEKFDFDLSNLLFKQKIELNLKQKSFMIMNIVDALNSCEKLKIIHNDLKPGNILVNKSQKKNQKENSTDLYTCYLNDFGCAEYYGNDELIKHGQLKRGADGLTVTYAAPERLGEYLGLIKTTSSILNEKQLEEFTELLGTSNSSLDSSSDVFSFGLIIYEILFGIKFINFETKVHQKVYEYLCDSNNYQGDPQTLSKLKQENGRIFKFLYQDIYLPCVSLDKNSRPTFSQLRSKFPK